MPSRDPDKARTKMRCEKCGEHPIWSNAWNDEMKATCECRLCGHQQQPRITAAKIERHREETERLNEIVSRFGLLA